MKLLFVSKLVIVIVFFFATSCKGGKVEIIKEQ